MATKRILVVDDDLVTREALAELLQDEGYAVELAVDRRDGEARFATFLPDLVLTALSMPRLDGSRLLAHIQTVSPTTPVLLITADTTLEAERTAQDLGAQDFLNKPLDFADVLMRIAHTLFP